MFAVAFQGPPSNSVASSIFSFLDKYQAQELVIPFLLTFVITYGVLDTIKIFKNSINAIVALAISFFAIFYGPYGAMGQFLTNLYGTGAVAIVGLVMFMIILGVFSLGGTHRPGVGMFQRLFGASGGVVGGIVIVVVFIFLLASGWFENIGIRLDPDTTALMIIILIIFALIMIVARPTRTRTWWHNMFPPGSEEGSW